MLKWDIKGYFERLITQPGQELGRWARFARFQIILWRYCARRLHEHNVMAMSAALSYRTIFAMIPVMVLALLVARSIGALEDRKEYLRKLLDASGFSQIVAVRETVESDGDSGGVATAPATTTAPVPATPTETDVETETQTEVINVADEIEKLVSHVESRLTFKNIGPVGGLLLIYTALSLLTNMEQCLNRIFGATRRRSMLRRLLLYWSTMTLGPVLLAAAAYLGRQAAQVFDRIPGLSSLMELIGWISPVLVGILVLASLYRLLPTAPVRFESAILGAVVAVLLWLIAKWAFALYVDRLVLKGNLYGVLGVLPLFMLWLYYTWLCFLFGAELSHTVVNLREMRLREEGARTVVGPSDVLAAAAAVACVYQDGAGPAGVGEIASRMRLSNDTVREVMERLRSAGLVCGVDDATEDRYLLSRPAERVTVREVLGVADPNRDCGAQAADARINGAIAAVQEKTENALGSMTLADLLGRQKTG